MNKKAIVLAGDYGYIRQIETTLKSIYYHNSDIVDIKMFQGNMQSWRLPPVGQHINFMTYARYFIPSFVSEDIVLYLDCDLIVTRDLTELFSIDLTDKPLVAAKVIYGLGDRFNAGGAID